ncbi:hypothetical protein HED52_10475 [Ochrobactrum ciceri]|uniref:Uncharacterized protein n=1 Tax=Brucella ciceri TaxID=391287 RepID=A0ABX1DTW8_9HYPH|nr:hypothetical protein [Brucella ciceri]
MHHDTRSKISVLRPLLIALVVSAHVPWTLYNPTSKEIDFTAWNVLRLTLTAVMSPIGMPLLSVISGFLVVSSFKNTVLMVCSKEGGQDHNSYGRLELRFRNTDLLGAVTWMGVTPRLAII